jgi:uncharacterized membrane protein (UPF0127 family)
LAGEGNKAKLWATIEEAHRVPTDREIIRRAFHDVNGESSMSERMRARARAAPWRSAFSRETYAALAWSIAMVALVGSTVAATEVGAWALVVLPSGAEITAEVATDAPSRQRGYMFREHVGPREGMLFVFDTTAHHGFWMKNCKIALDMIWLDEQLRVVDVAHDRQPCPETGACPTIQPMRAARYVLELAAGGARREGLDIGDRISVLWEAQSR